MLKRHFFSLTLLVAAVTALPMTLAPHSVLADDSETMNSQPQNYPQYGAYPNQGDQYQGNQNRGYWSGGNGNQENRNNRVNSDNESKASRFSRQGRAERGGGGGDDGGDD